MSCSAKVAEILQDFSLPNDMKYFACKNSANATVHTCLSHTQVVVYLSRVFMMKSTTVASKVWLSFSLKITHC